MTGGWLFTTVSYADPVALRGPRVEPTAVVGLHELSVAAPFGDGTLAAAASMRTDRAAADVALGRRWRLRGDDLGWRADAGISVGVIVPLVRPGVGLTVTPHLAAGPVGRRGFVQGVVAAPLALAVPNGARLPLWFELQGGGTAGRVSVGPRLGFAIVATPGTDVSVSTEGALLVSVRTR